MKKIVFVFSLALPFYANAWEPCGTDANGNTANCEYQIDASGTLTIRGTGNNGNIGYWYDSSSGRVISPWLDKDVKNVVISEGIKDLGHYAFASIKSDNPITIPSTVTTIGTHAMFMVEAPEVIIPNTVTKIESAAFNWSSITKMDIPTSVLEIDSAFRGTHLADLVIPDTVQKMTGDALTKCAELKTLTIGENTQLGGIFAIDSDPRTNTNLENLKIYCTGDTAKCDANLEAAGYPDLKSSKATTKQINGVTYIYDKSGKLVTRPANAKKNASIPLMKPMPWPVIRIVYRLSTDKISAFGLIFLTLMFFCATIKGNNKSICLTN